MNSVVIEKNIPIPSISNRRSSHLNRKVAHYKQCDVEINQENIKKALTYHPETGHFIWNEGHGMYGKRAGSICKRFGYRHITIYGRRCIEHRLAWLYVHGSIKPHHHICHLNGVRDDNSIQNLRESKSTVITQATRTATKGYRMNETRTMGDRFHAEIHVNNKTIKLGTFSTAGEAHQAYVDAKKKYHATFEDIT